MQSKLLPVKYNVNKRDNNNKDNNKVKDGLTPFCFLVTLSIISLLLKGSFTKTLTYLYLGLLELLLPSLLLLLPVRKLLLSLFTSSVLGEGCDLKLNILNFFSTMKKSRVSLAFLRLPLPSEPYVIVSHHTALHLEFDTRSFNNNLLPLVYLTE